MKRLILGFFLVGISAGALASSQHGASSRTQWHGFIDLQIPVSDSTGSFLNPELGKLRYDESSNGELRLGFLGASLSHELSSVSKLKISALFNRDPDENLQVTEAFWHYRPIPKSIWRKQLKAGAFYAPLSLENRGPVWSSVYSITPSVINSWVGDELRTLGAEYKTTWQGAKRGSAHQFSTISALYFGNDPLGSVIAWRGWTHSDRQTGIGERLPLADLPNLAPGRGFPDQARKLEPFKEIDGRPGFYVGGEWQYRRSIKTQLFYYDNQAKASSFEEGQYGWHTRFSQLALSWKLSDSLELLSQVLAGDTQMDSKVRSRVVDNDFYAGYLMLSKRVGAHRFSARWERFGVRDKDTTVMDSNDERGRSSMLYYGYRWNKHWKLGLQWIESRSDRRARKYFGDPRRTTERQLLASLRYHWQ